MYVCACARLKRKQLSNRTIGPSTWPHTHNCAAVYTLCNMKWSKLCSGICFGEDEQILHKIFVQSFLYDVICYIMLCYVCFSKCWTLPEMSASVSASVNGIFFHWIEQQDTVGLPLPPPPSPSNMDFRPLLPLLFHRRCCCSIFLSRFFHVVFERSMWTTFANSAVFSLHYVKTHANLENLFGSFFGLFLASSVFIH